MDDKKQFCQNEYIREYNKCKYKNIKIAAKPNDFNMIDNYCKEIGMSKAQFIVKSCKYIIDNNIELK